MAISGPYRRYIARQFLAVVISIVAIPILILHGCFTYFCMKVGRLDHANADRWGTRGCLAFIFFWVGLCVYCAYASMLPVFPPIPKTLTLDLPIHLHLNGSITHDALAVLTLLMYACIGVFVICIQGILYMLTYPWYCLFACCFIGACIIELSL